MEQLVETSLRRVLQAPLDITFLKRRLERAMEANQIVVNGKTLVPHYYCVMLNAQDFVNFKDGISAHQYELVDYLEKLAQSRSFATQRPIQVEPSLSKLKNTQSPPTTNPRQTCLQLPMMRSGTAVAKQQTWLCL